MGEAPAAAGGAGTDGTGGTCKGSGVGNAGGDGR